MEKHLYEYDDEIYLKDIYHESKLGVEALGGGRVAFAGVCTTRQFGDGGGAIPRDPWEEVQE